MRLRHPVLLSVVPLLFASTTPEHLARKGVISVRIVSVTGREVPIVAVVSNGYVDAPPSFLRSVSDVFTSSWTRLQEEQRRIRPHVTKRMTTPAFLVMYPHNASVDVSASNGETVAIEVRGSNGGEVVRVTGRAVEIRTAGRMAFFGPGGEDAPVGPNRLSEYWLQFGWRAIFNGRNLHGWHVQNAGGGPSNWIISDTALRHVASSARRHRIVSDSLPGVTSIYWEWRIAAGQAPRLPSSLTRGMTRAEAKLVRAPGVWNSAQIDFESGQKVWLNGHRIVGVDSAATKPDGQLDWLPRYSAGKVWLPAGDANIAYRAIAVVTTVQRQ